MEFGDGIKPAVSKRGSLHEAELRQRKGFVNRVEFTPFVDAWWWVTLLCCVRLEIVQKTNITEHE